MAEQHHSQSHRPQAQERLSRKDESVESSAEGVENLEAKLSDVPIEMIIASQVSGPLPAPQILQGYERTHAGAADRIIAMAEQEQAHHHAMEKRALEAQIASERSGSRFGFAISLAFLAAAIGLIATGHGIEGTILGSVDLIALVGIFVYGRYSQARELTGKRKALDD